MLDQSVLSYRTFESQLPPSHYDDAWELAPESDISHHLMSFESVLLNPDLILGDKFIAIPRPDDVEKIPFEVDGIPMECLYMPPPEKNPQAIVGLLTGTKMPSWAYEQERKILHEMGFAVVALTQTNAIDRKGFTDHHVEAAEAFLFDRESPLYRMGPTDVPRIIVTHSASGPYAIKASLNATAKGRSVREPMMMHLAPCIAPAGASELFTPLRARMYNWHTQRVPDVVCGQHWRDKAVLWPRGVNLPERGVLGKIFSWSKHQTLHPDPRLTPTHGQADEIMRFGRGLLAQVMSEAFVPPWSKEHHYAISSQDDFASCPRSARLFAEAVGQYKAVAKGDHSPVSKSDEGRMIFKKIMSGFVDQSRKPVLIYTNEKPTTAPLPAAYNAAVPKVAVG